MYDYVYSIAYTTGTKTSNVHLGLSGDNPVYETGNTTVVLNFGNLSSNHVKMPASEQGVNVMTSHDQNEYGQERKFDNPIYGDGETDDGVYTTPLQDQQGQGLVQDHEFDNPIYGTETDDQNV